MKPAANAAALQFPFGFAAVASVLFGLVRPEEVVANLRRFETPIPPACGAELRREGLVSEAAPLPSA